jgi:long-chain acyl-CoA synthetase
LDDAGPSPVFISLTDRLRARAAERPDHIALIQDESVVTYGDVDAATDRIAATFQVLGLKPHDVVAICASPSIAYVEVFCGALRAGLVVAPLAPSASPESLTAMVCDSGAKLLFIDRETAALFASNASQVQAHKVRLDRDLCGWMIAEGARPATVAIEPHWTFNIIYSSGTTGAPKGIVQPHLMRTPYELPGAAFGYGPQAVALISTGLYSNTTLVSLFPALGGGGTVVLMTRFEARRFLELAARWRVTHAMLVPVQYQRILAVPDFDSFDLSAFEMKFCTSAPFLTALKAEVLARWPGGLTEYYGMTEGGAGTVLYAHETPAKLHTVGKPWPHIDVRLIDDDGREVALGEIGEVVGASELMMSSYHNQPEKTSEATWRDSEGRRFIRNGDIGRFDGDGFLILLDRKKDMIISGGFNVYPSDLEAVLTQHPAVAEAAVVGVPSAAWGETPVAFVVLSADVRAEAEAIRGWVNARVGKVQRLAAVEILAALPRNPIGKVLKRELRDSFGPPKAV